MEMERVFQKDRNLLDSQVNISRCRICESINHWEDDCPDNTNGKLKTPAEIILFQSVLHEQETLTGLTGEAFNTATLNPDVSKTACRKTQLKHYQTKSNATGGKKVHSVFNIRDGQKDFSLRKVTIPAKI